MHEEHERKAREARVQAKFKREEETRRQLELEEEQRKINFQRRHEGQEIAAKRMAKLKAIAEQQGVQADEIKRLEQEEAQRVAKRTEGKTKSCL